MLDLKRRKPEFFIVTLASSLALLTGCPGDDGGGNDEVGPGDTGTETATTDTTGTETGTSDTTTTDTTTTDTGTDTTTDTTTSDTGTGTDTTTSDTGTDTTTTDTGTDTTDTTGTDTGDPPILDSDMDGVPDPDDPFPDDPNLPGTAQPNLVYAHTSSRLYTMDPFSYQIVEIGPFTFNQSSGSVTDIAIDRWGVLYAVTFNDLFVCDPQSAACIYLADLPSSFNGLTMVPPGTIDANDDTLLGIANNGNWYQITVVNQQAMLQQIGAYGGGMTSAGDVFSIQGTGTFGSVNKPGVNNGNVVVECNPLNGMVIDELATTVGYTSLWGLAGWDGKIFGFNSGGQVIEVDPNDGTVTQIAATNYSWWGAGVFTIVPQ